jgi:hypothetical protein
MLDAFFVKEGESSNGSGCCASEPNCLGAGVYGHVLSLSIGCDYCILATFFREPGIEMATVLFLLSQSRAILQYRAPVQSLVGVYVFLMLSIKWSTSALFMYFTQKSSMTRVNEIGCNSWYHNPGVFTCSKYPKRADFFLKWFLARIPACSKPQTARHISEWTYPLCANHCKMYWSCIQTGNRSRGIHIYSRYSSLAIKWKFLMSRHMYVAHFVLITLFQWSLAVPRSAVHTDGLDLYLTRLPPAVIRIQFGSSLWGG